MSENNEKEIIDDKDKDQNQNEENAKEDSVKEKKASEPKKKKEKKLSEKEKLANELADEKNKYLRLVAEYDNFRKRSAKEKLESYGDATAKAISEMLPIYDNFERALQAETTDENFKKGVTMIFNQYSEFLKKLNVEIIDPIGQEFDPNVAQAINQIEDEKLGENEVAQVFQKGYKIGDKIIRYAMVVVANP